MEGLILMAALTAFLACCKGHTGFLCYHCKGEGQVIGPCGTNFGTCQVCKGTGYTKR